MPPQTKESLAAKKAAKREKKQLKKKRQDQSSAAAALDAATNHGEKPASEVISAPIEAKAIDGEVAEGAETSGADVASTVTKRNVNMAARVEEVEDE